jgi:LAO/AO transport system kinase
MGKDCIIVETVGVGQDEVDIAGSAHTTVVVTIPGMGDDIQSLKAGLLEIGDIFVVNKAEREGADKTVSHLASMIEMGQRNHGKDSWQIPVLKAEALSKRGVAELVEKIDDHAEYLASCHDDLQHQKNKEKAKQELIETLKNLFFQEIIEPLIRSGEIDGTVGAIVAGEMDPYTAAETIMSKTHGRR